MSYHKNKLETPWIALDWRTMECGPTQGKVSTVWRRFVHHEHFDTQINNKVFEWCVKSQFIGVLEGSFLGVWNKRHDMISCIAVVMSIIQIFQIRIRFKGSY